MRALKRFFSRVSPTATGLLLAAGLLSACAFGLSATDSQPGADSNAALMATIRSLDAAPPAATETATLALG